MNLRTSLGYILFKLQSTFLYKKIIRKISQSNYKFCTTRDDDTKNDSIGYIITVKKNDKLIGKVAVRNFQKIQGSYIGWWLFNIWVSPFYRRRGIGEELVKSVISLVKENGGKEIFLTVGDRATHVQNLYKKLGFNFKDTAQEANETQKKNERLGFLRIVTMVKRIDF